MNKNPLISIVIVNYNGKNHLQKCLPSIMKLNYKNYEIIIVDNNSTDNSIEYVKNSFPSVIIIKLDKNYGFAEPNNIGAKNAKGDFLLFLNNDTIVTPDCVNELLKIIQSDEKIAICQSLLLKLNNEVDSSGDFVDNLGRAYRSKKRPNNQQEILSARGAAMLVRKNSFWDLGGFDKDFFVSFEDVDLGWRAWIWGYKVVLVPRSIVFHFGSQTIKKHNTEIQFHGIKNNLILRMANFETSHAFSSVFMFFLINAIRKLFGYSIIKDVEEISDIPSSKIIFKSVIWIFKNSKYILRKHNEVNSRRVKSTKDLMTMGLITNKS